MSGADVVTGALCMALTGLGLVIAVQKARQRRFLNATRWTAAALFPIGLYLTGLATLGRRVGSAVADWATDLAFGLKAWGGVAILAFAVILLMITRMVGGKKKSAEPSGTASTTSSDLSALLGGGGPAAGAGGSGGALPRSQQPKPAAAPRSRRSSRASGGDDEFAEIEELLRRRGI
ncbi:hypothetical protein [Embleya hyalina]|uniref:Cellulose synthase n=1 Tax=Embleya hyalina TaxID=516124 RepID=A0A401Z4F4_9ACTN|nr:hypothetical protein [Embleya hyalina]GCE01715.1 hypothetical protein EHYA_09488 [Embleya hyalina]